MANPAVRKHLTFYPEDAGDSLSEAWQAKRWKDELDSDLTTPMIREHGQDFYINELAVLKSGGVCMPHRWFTRGGKMFALSWTVKLNQERTGWIIQRHREYEISSSLLLLSFPRFVESHMHYNLPHPHNIIGMFCHSYTLR